jgi:hypothetical protein
MHLNKRQKKNTTNLKIKRAVHKFCNLHPETMTMGFLDILRRINQVKIKSPSY